MKGSEAVTGLTVKEKQAVIRESYQRYQSSGKNEKSKILDQLCRITGPNRKYLLRLPANRGKTATVFLDGKRVTLKAARLKKPRKKPAKSSTARRSSPPLKPIREYFGFMCGQLLAPFIRANMTFLEQEEVFHITPAVKEKLLAVSSAAVNRKLKEERKKSLLRGFSGNKRGKYLKHTIPVNHRFSR